ncbi:hypothetical protein A3B18_03445 [Candidatus Giovannonibacteria bacterium RIFCSPLOWO2_01_FULL_46_13]|uniref:Uncharacterized protein n=1 Tax=Candidatus Giovannonibacteria bacterium RIFCSPLOWO2_01_FULL_46_13 TaxID=1798352 RepID=A0A1F5X428_9BACT|nr:MAG: hypothetical protein A3B18_03445 [Candidatus Giovannonibacteria bacterium RIFCSPLOWO2_01_FULL_46_13]
MKEISEDLNKENGPILAGIKILFADMGISGAIGFIIGMVLGAAGMTGEQLQDPSSLIQNLGIIVGLLVSVYMAFLLYRSYSQDIKAFVALLIAGLIFSAIHVYVNMSSTTPNLMRDLMAVIAQVVSYFVGWYAAKNTDLQLFLPSRKWVIGFLVAGIVIAFFGVLGFVTVIFS